MTPVIEFCLGSCCDIKLLKFSKIHFKKQCKKCKYNLLVHNIYTSTCAIYSVCFIQSIFKACFDVGGSGMMCCRSSFIHCGNYFLSLCVERQNYVSVVLCF